jgi:dUTP pyrophosphatase
MTSIILRIAIEDQELRDLYVPHIRSHNDAVTNTSHPNAGFDLFVPQVHSVPATIQTYKLNHGVRAEMLSVDLNGNIQPTGFLLMPRSSLSNTSLMLANHVGVVDSGYRGDLIGAFRNLGQFEFVAERGIRLLQVCHPSLTPFRVEMVSSVNDLSVTARGACGFGSTGR